MAVCQQTGSTVTCTGTTNVFSAPAGTPLTINVEPLATVQSSIATTPAITFAPDTAGNVLTNEGAITASSTFAIGVRSNVFDAAGTNTFNNFGTISAEGQGAGSLAFGMDLQSQSGASTINVINNSGATIEGSASSAGVGIQHTFGVLFGQPPSAQFAVQNAGTISGTTFGVAAGAGSRGLSEVVQVDNSGTIRGGSGSTDRAIRLGDEPSTGTYIITNTAAGTIDGDVELQGGGVLTSPMAGCSTAM